MGTDGPKDCAEPLLPTEACGAPTGSLGSALLQNRPRLSGDMEQDSQWTPSGDSRFQDVSRKRGMRQWWIQPNSKEETIIFFSCF